MGSRKIVIASVLKPVDDTRMFEKIGISLAKNLKYDVNIVGFSSKTKTPSGRVKFYPIFRFDRRSPARLFAGLLFLRKVYGISPDTLIITSPELLIPAALYKWVRKGAQLVYDVQENYYQNVIHGDHYPRSLRPVIGSLVRLVEKITRPAVDHFLLAEKCYRQELGFVNGKNTVIENKHRVPSFPPSAARRGRHKLIYTGTIARSYGIFEAIGLFLRLYQIDQSYHLSIAGFCPRPSVRKEIETLVLDHPGISIFGMEELIPHQQIVQLIQESDFGIIAYKQNPATDHCIPTRLYEYIGSLLPVIIPRNPVWEQMCTSFQAGFAVDFDHYDPAEVHRQIQTQPYYSLGNPTDVYWESEEKRLISLVSGQLNA